MMSCTRKRKVDVVPGVETPPAFRQAEDAAKLAAHFYNEAEHENETR